MPQTDRSPRVDKTDARAGSKEGVVRWVLAISLGLTVLAFAIIVLSGALSQGPVESQQNAERKVEAAREQGTGSDSTIDGVVVDDEAAGAPTSNGAP
ncbi:hypothetical protein ACLBKU_02440 [Erythrobacter sp. NE805]|uniref:hypothetical protein n=1 Tax=Erythrobacter sp. NE805 TaxID=3389875 RepID=UPI00396B07EF